MAAIDTSERSFVRRVFIATAAVIVTVLCLTFIYFTFDILMLIFAAALLAIFLHGLADLVGRWVPLGPGWRVLITSALLTIVMAGAVALLAPSVAEQGRELRVEIPRSAQRAGEYISQFAWGQALLAQVPGAEELMAKVEPSAVLSMLGGYFSSTVGAAGNVLVTILIAIYLASGPALYSGGFTRLFPVASRKRTGQVLNAVYETLRWWLIGKAASMLFIAVLTWLGLSILGVPLALTLGLIAGLLSFIPNFGPLIAAVPALLLAFIDSPLSAAYVAALYIGIQVVEGNVVTPLIERETVELPPALTIISQLALGALIGGLGLVLATPLLAVVVVLVRMVYIQDVLGDDIVETEAEHRGIEKAEE